MVASGFGWINNFTITDSSLILPATFGLMTLAVVWVNYLKFEDVNFVQRCTVGFLSLTCLGMAIVAKEMPSGMVLYWTASAGYGLIFNLLLTVPSARKFLRIPEVKSAEERKKDIAEWLAMRRREKEPDQEVTIDETLAVKTKKV